jgi:hypothetical protein
LAIEVALFCRSIPGLKHAGYTQAMILREEG